MNRSIQPVSAELPEARPAASRLLVGGALLAYLALATIAVLTGNGLLAVACAMLLVSFVLARGLIARRATAWLAWIAIAAGLALLARRGNGGLALELLPVAANLALAWFFGHTLAAGRTPLIARAIIAMEGRERLALPRVAGYARALTWAWAVLMSAQTALLALIVGARHGLFASAPTALAGAYLFLGGWLVPAVFMLGEYAFRRWYLRDLPHDPPHRFVRRLAMSWPRLLRDTVDPGDAGR